MTISHRKRGIQPDEISTINEPGLQIQCDSCNIELTHSVRIKCADPVCEPGDGVDICPTCFCAGKEFGNHKRDHEYRVVELHSYPIFSEDWGADEELLLIEGITLQGIGNWKKIADHVGTRTTAEVAKHYNEVYVDSPDWPRPRMNLEFTIDPEEFQERKRRRIAEINATVPPLPKDPPTSAPAFHEIGTYLPGRLEFEHEIDNEAEDLIKDLEFGVVLTSGGDEILEDEDDPDVKARKQWEEEKRLATKQPQVVSPPLAGKGLKGVKVPAIPARKGKGPMPIRKTPVNGIVNGHSSDGETNDGSTTKAEDDKDKGDGEEEENREPPPIETADSIKFKLTLLEMYKHRVDKRHETKAFIFDRGLLEYKKMQAADKKRPKEEKDIITRLRPFSRLQSAEDFEKFTADTLYEIYLRKRIQELQTYRRLGLTTPADIDKYELDLNKRTAAKNAAMRDHYSNDRQGRSGSHRHSLGPGARGSSVDGDYDRDSPKVSTIRKIPQPLNLANSPSLHLLTPAEQTLCSQLRILPKPYLVIKETLVREYARRGGKLRRREARDLVKIDVNKTARVWDFLVQAGFLRIGTDVQPQPRGQNTEAPATANAGPSSTSTSGSQPPSNPNAMVVDSPTPNSAASMSRPPAPPSITSVPSSSSVAPSSATLPSSSQT